VPAIVARKIKIVLVWNLGLVESAVMWMAETDVLEAFIALDETVANDLDLRLVRNGLQVRVQNGTLGVQSLPMAVRGSGGIKAVGEMELGLGSDMALVGKVENLVLEQGLSDDIKVGICI
jgi:hypothetical protein